MNRDGTRIDLENLPAGTLILGRACIWITTGKKCKKQIGKNLFETGYPAVFNFTDETKMRGNAVWYISFLKQQFQKRYVKIILP